MRCGPQILKRKDAEACCKGSWVLTMSGLKSPRESLFRWRDEGFSYDYILLTHNSTFTDLTLFSAPAMCQVVGMQR